MKQTTFLAFAILAMSLANATPTTAPGVSISNDTDSAAFPDSVDKRRLWVLPPLSGRAAAPKLSLQTPSSECDALSNIVDAAKSYSKQINILAKQRETIIGRLGQLDDKTSEEAIKLYSRTEQINTLILNAYTSMNKLTADEGKKLGGTLLMPFVHDIDKNIAKLKATNPSFSDVQPVQTYNARLYFSAPGSAQDGIDLSLLPVIMNYSVNGIGATNMAKGEFRLAPRIDVTLSLTRLGACMIGFPQKFGSGAAPRFGLTAVYEYPYLFNHKVTAKYNILSIYKFIKESGSRGGFFSSSSWSRAVESNWGASAFSIAWADDDPESKISAAERVQIERAIKADLLANLDLLIRAKVDYKVSDAANPGPRGATVLAEGLEKNCAANAYCAAAAVALRVLDAVFGSSSTSTEVERALNVTATYALDSKTARYVTQGVSYTAD